MAIIPAGVLLLVLASALGANWISSISWPAVLSLSGLVLVWRNAPPDERALLDRAVSPLLRSARQNLDHAGAWMLARLLAAGALIGVGLFFLLTGRARATALRPLAGAVLVVAAAIVLFGPWWLRIARDLMLERQARARAEERADLAARVHDSVLQTLALIQRNAANPQQVVQLARNQERELRSWLFDGSRPGLPGDEELTFAGALGRIQRDVEAAHGIRVETVVVGDCPLDEHLRALVAAGREATVNAAKWSGQPVVALFGEVERESVSLFVRDRGVGFEPERVPADRKGIAESMRGRMARHGGSVTIRSVPGEGTEVALSMSRAA